MPIKFRCQHCRQFLGISRSKAGEIFDCPTCGWTLRVPDLDGTTKPLPGPGLDMEDSKLAQALDELASMDNSEYAAPIRSPANSAGGTGIEGRVIDDRQGNDCKDSSGVGADSAGMGNRDRDSAAPDAGIRTMPEPIVLPPLPAPEPIDIEPRFRAGKPIAQESTDDDEDDDSSAAARPWRSTAQAGNSWKRLLAAAEFGVTEGDSTDEPVKEADPAVAIAAVGTDPARPDAVSVGLARMAGVLQLSGATWFALAGIGAVIFAAGFWMGRVTTLPVAQEPSEARSEALVGEAKPETTSTDTNGEESQTAFRGRITYRTEAGERKPDRGARVIVLPVVRKGTARLSVTGLRSSDQPEDQRFAQSGIRTLGGDVATANDSGEFEIKLPGSGKFYILALSNSLSREEDTDAKEVEAALTSYFERPTQLLGRVMHHFEEVRYSGGEVTPWDYSFSQP